MANLFEKCWVSQLIHPLLTALTKEGLCLAEFWMSSASFAVFFWRCSAPWINSISTKPLSYETTAFHTNPPIITPQLPSTIFSWRPLRLSLVSFQNRTLDNTKWNSRNFQKTFCLILGKALHLKTSLKIILKFVQSKSFIYGHQEMRCHW